MLVGTSQCQIALRPDGEQPESANRLNRVFGSRVQSIADAKTSGGLASWRLGTGPAAPPLVQFIAARLLSGEREDNADAWIKALSADVVPEKHDTVRKVVHDRHRAARADPAPAADCTRLERRSPLDNREYTAIDHTLLPNCRRQGHDSFRSWVG